MIVVGNTRRKETEEETAEQKEVHCYTFTGEQNVVNLEVTNFSKLFHETGYFNIPLFVCILA